MEYLSRFEEETVTFAERLVRYLKAGDILCLFGNLGAGKTTFVKGLAKGLNIDPDQVRSPTFVLMNAYEGRLPMYHFDFYRLEDLKEIPALGYEEFFYGDGITVVEWPERMQSLIPEEYLDIHLLHRTENHRLITMKAEGTRFKSRMETWRL